RRPPHREPDAGGASPRAWPRDGGWAAPSGAGGRGAPWVAPPGPRGDGRLSGEDGGREPADFGAWGVRPTRPDGPAAGAHPPEPHGPPDAAEGERADHGARCARRGGVTYRARSLRGGPLKHARLGAWDRHYVTFPSRTRQEAAAGARPGLQ